MFIERSVALRVIKGEAAALSPEFGGCVMCALVADAPTTHVLCRTRRSVAVLARFGVRRGHLLVVLRRHVERFEEITWPEWQDAQRVAWEAARAAERALGATRVYVASLGSATQRPMTFPHHHLHVVPTYRGDRRDRPAAVFTWQDGVVLQDERDAARLTRELRAAWPMGARGSERLGDSHR